MATRAVKTVDVDAGLLAETRNAMKPSAEVPDAEVVERALRSYLGRRALDASQAMPREAMFYAYTRNSARAMNMESSIGTIAAGKRADLVLLDRDVLTVSPEEMRGTKVVWTMVKGEVVWRAK